MRSSLCTQRCPCLRVHVQQAPSPTGCLRLLPKQRFPFSPQLGLAWEDLTVFLSVAVGVCCLRSSTPSLPQCWSQCEAEPQVCPFPAMVLPAMAAVGMRAEILTVTKDSMINAGHCLTHVGSTNGNQQAQSENLYLRRRRKKNCVTAF